MKIKYICLIIAILLLIASCTTETQPTTELEEPLMVEEDEDTQSETEPEILDVTGAITKEIVE